jgi:DNA-binding beta-propeller fold protein YncE
MVARIRVLVLSLALVAAVFGSVALAEDPPEFLLKWGVRGSGDGEFDSPGGIAVDSSGYVYVADYLNHRVQKFTADGEFVTKWGTEGLGDGQLYLPKGIAVDKRGVVYVAEYGNRRVQKFTSDGGFLGYLVIWDFQRAWGVAVDESNNVFVTSPDGRGVFTFSSTGVPLTSWGTQGTGDGQFEAPSGIAVDANGYVYVSDIINDNVQTFTSDGVFVDRWLNEELYEPPGVAVDPTGHVFVTTSHQRVLKLTSDGVVVSVWGAGGSGDGEFYYPHGIAAVGSVVYVVDGVNCRIQKFGYPVFVQPGTWGQVKTTYR